MFAQQAAKQPQPEQFLSLDHFLSDPPADRYPEPQSVGRAPAEWQRGRIDDFQHELGANQRHGQPSPRLQSLSSMPQHVAQPPNRFPASTSPRVVSTSPLRVDKHEILRRQQEKQQTLELRRKQEIEKLRNQARQKEEQR